MQGYLDSLSSTIAAAVGNAGIKCNLIALTYAVLECSTAGTSKGSIRLQICHAIHLADYNLAIVRLTDSLKASIQNNLPGFRVTHWQWQLLNEWHSEQQT